MNIKKSVVLAVASVFVLALAGCGVSHTVHAPDNTVQSMAAIEMPSIIETPDDYEDIVTLPDVLPEGWYEFLHRAPDEIIDDPNVALAMLIAGNERFVYDALMPRNTTLADRDINATGQWPFASIVTCADSRVAPELYFDQKVGDLFVVRNAGNFADETAIGSLEFSVAVLGSRLIVVVGHTDCGAIIHAHGGTTGLPTALQNTLGRIAELIPYATDVEEATREGVMSSVEILRANEVVIEHGALVVGAVFDIETGRVIFIEDLPY